MIIIEKPKKRKWGQPTGYKGSGFFDSLISAITGNTAKEIATNVTKKALTDLGNKASEKVINKIFDSPKVEDPMKAERRRKIESLLSRGKGIKRI